MKSQINLLNEEFIPKFEWVCANHFTAMLVFVTFICAGGYGLTNYLYTNKKTQVDDIKQKIKIEQTSIDELTTALAARVTDPVLESQLNDFSEQTRVRGQLLSHIRNLSGLKQRSFSGLFDSLAKASRNDLWLTTFKVNPDSLNLEGQLAKPKALPIWISQLSETGFFKGQEFNVASVDRDNDMLLFSLDSKRKETDSQFAVNSDSANRQESGEGGVQP